MFQKMNKKWWPLLLVAGAILLFILMTSLRSTPDKTARLEVVPVVKVTTLRQEPIQFNINATGSVSSSNEISLITRVAGEIINLSENMKSGGMFKKGEILFGIDPTDYQLQVDMARADVARNKVEFEIKQEESKIAEQEWNLYNSKESNKEASQLVLLKPQLQLSEANLKAAQAKLELAVINLRRTKVRAPFHGRVKHRIVNEGQYVRPGTALASIFNINQAEIVIPLQTGDLRWIDLSSESKAKAIISADYGGRINTWEGYLDRIEGELDPKNRMINSVVIVPSPYDKKYSYPLMNGLFVEVKIEGVYAPEIFKIPGYAVHEFDQVWLAKNDTSLLVQKINIVKSTEESVFTDTNLGDGSFLIISPLSFVVNGMKIQVEGN